MSERKPPNGIQNNEPDGLNLKQRRFVASYLRHGVAKQAAIEAGYSPASAKHTAHRLLYESPKVKAALAKEQKKLQEKTGYSAEEGMKEAGQAMEFAKETGNANAYVKAVELRAKLNGLLIEKHDVRAIGDFQINIEGFKKPTAEEIEAEWEREVEETDGNEKS
jgi:hypothetical protein